MSTSSDLVRQLDAGAVRDTDPAMHQRIRSRLRLDDVPLAHDLGPVAATGDRRHRLRRPLLALTAVAAIATGFTIVDRPDPAMASLTPEALATWTDTAQPAGDTTVERNSCLREYGDGIADDPRATFLLEERRGELTSMIASYQDTTVFCIIGPDDTGLLDSMSGIEDPDRGGAVDLTDRPEVGLTAAVSGGRQDGPENERVHYVTGRYAADVQSIDLQLTDGRQLTASMQDGWFTAWWTGAPQSADTQVTWTDSGGTPTTTVFADLSY